MLNRVKTGDSKCYVEFWLKKMTKSSQANTGLLLVFVISFGQKFVHNDAFMSYITGCRIPLYTPPVICFMNSAPFAPVKRHPELNFETQKVDWFLFQLCDIKFN